MITRQTRLFSLGGPISSRYCLLSLVLIDVVSLVPRSVSWCSMGIERFDFATVGVDSGYTNAERIFSPEGQEWALEFVINLASGVYGRRGRKKFSD